MNSQKNKLGPRKLQAAHQLPALHGVLLPQRGIACRLGSFRRSIDANTQVVHRVVQFQKTHAGLQADLHPLSEVRQVFWLQRPLAGRIKRNNVCPFQLRHIECQNRVRPRMTRVCAQPRFKPTAEIAQSKRFRRTFQKIRLRHALECGPAQNGNQTREVVAQRFQQAEPVASVVDFQALERFEPGVRLDQARGLLYFSISA